MFDQSFVVAEPKTRKLRVVAGSFLLQSLILGAGILVPLIYTETLPTAQLKSLFVGPPPPAEAPRKPPPTVTARVVTPRSFSLSKLVAPRATPRRVNRVDSVDSAPDIGVPGGTGATDGTANPLLSMTLSAPPAPPPAPVPIAKRPAGVVRVGGVVAEANLIRRVQPSYPALARTARIQGTVEFAAVIDKEGRVENLQLISGHPLLIQAAREAILQWRYRPTLLNGQPVEVSTTITVKFTLTP